MRSIITRADRSCSSVPHSPARLLSPHTPSDPPQVTTVTLEDLPGCGLSTLALCTRLQFLRLRRCGLRSLHGVSQLQQLSYVDVQVAVRFLHALSSVVEVLTRPHIFICLLQDNDISFVDCENMTSLRVLLLGRNKLTSIHGLAGAENLDVLDLSYNSISRIGGNWKRTSRLSQHLVYTVKNTARDPGLL